MASTRAAQHGPTCSPAAPETDSADAPVPHRPHACVLDAPPPPRPPGSAIVVGTESLRGNGAAAGAAVGPGAAAGPAAGPAAGGGAAAGVDVDDGVLSPTGLSVRGAPCAAGGASSTVGFAVVALEDADVAPPRRLRLPFAHAPAPGTAATWLRAFCLAACRRYVDPCERWATDSQSGGGRVPRRVAVRRALSLSSLSRHAWCAASCTVRRCRLRFFLHTLSHTGQSPNDVSSAEAGMLCRGRTPRQAPDGVGLPSGGRPPHEGQRRAGKEPHH